MSFKYLEVITTGTQLAGYVIEHNFLYKEFDVNIYLSVVSASRDLEGSAIDKAITAMAIRLTQLSKTMKDNANVSIDLTLMLPSENQRPDFEGMRMTHYSSTDEVLYIESAVPLQMLHSEQADHYVSALLQDAVENAAEFFSDQGMQFCSADWQERLQ